MNPKEKIQEELGGVANWGAIVCLLSSKLRVCGEPLLDSRGSVDGWLSVLAHSGGIERANAANT